MAEPQQYPKRTVLIARASFVLTGFALISIGIYLETFLLAVFHFLGYGFQVLGAMALGFGAFARGNICTVLFLRLLNRLVN